MEAEFFLINLIQVWKLKFNYQIFFITNSTSTMSGDGIRDVITSDLLDDINVTELMV